MSGAIYIKIGTSLPRDIQNELIEMIREMKQFFIWEHEQIEFSLPSNVLINESFLCKQILTHKNTSIFITKDDKTAIRQSLHFGIPMLILSNQKNEVNNYTIPCHYYFSYD